MTTATMDVLLVGGGGREHALAWKLLQSPQCGRILVAPGNGGTRQMGPRVVNVTVPATPADGSDASSVRALVALAVEAQVGLVVVGPEQPLVDGIHDACKKVGIACFGPSQLAAQLEGSKAFAKEFMVRHAIPTADFKTVTSYDEGKHYIEQHPHRRHVIKASGLAAGKGVLMPSTSEEALAALDTLLVQREFGAACDQVVIEECLEGQECSIIAFTDGHTVCALPAAQDHKRALDGDQGPNTGGMGAYAPAPVVTKQLMQKIHDTVMQPTVDGMRRDGCPFIGCLYAGIMLTAAGPKVLEFNCRLGDPETQVLLPLLTDDTDLLAVMLACCGGHLDSVAVRVRPGVHAATVVAAAQGYPAAYKRGTQIDCAAAADDGTMVFHAGTQMDITTGQLTTSGGRVLAVTAMAETLPAALDRIYAALGTSVKFDGMHFRRDIGHRALAKTAANKTAMTYADAGVSIDAGNELVQQIKAVVKATRRPGADADIGGFGGVFDLQAAGYGNSKNSDNENSDSDSPLLVSATDGVGTKLKVAQLVGRHDTIGIDLVAMNVNDLVVQAAEPLLFLDYFACGHLDVEVARQVVTGVAEGCRRANCALVGGETAEMPGLYAEGDYDLAGFTVGAVRRHQLLPRMDSIAEGDVLLGVPSSGVHSNGYSLVRHVVTQTGADYSQPCPFTAGNGDNNHGLTLGEVLLTPTRIYVRSLLPAVRSGLVKALAHITGGGFPDNIPRVIPAGFGVTMDARTWPLLPVFKWLKRAGGISAEEMCRTFNCGLGMVMVVARKDVDAVKQLLRAADETVYEVGHVRALRNADESPVRVENTQHWNNDEAMA